MEVKLWRALYALVVSVSHAPRRKREQYADAWVLAVALWAVVHDRPMRWACDRRNWPGWLDTPLPSPSRLSRRLRTVGVLQLLERTLAAAVARLPVPMVKAVDSKPLLVGAYSKDADAKRGRLADGCFARGYRLHALCHGRAVYRWVLAPMNRHDAAVAPELLPHL